MIASGASRVEYRLLGPVEVWVDGQPVDAGQPRQRAVLAALLVDAGRVVPIETLITRVWGQVVPEHARATLRTHLSRIRRLLEPAEERGAPAPLSRVPGGYLLRVEPDQIDVHLFRRLVGAAGSPVQSLRAALALWRGEPLAGIDGEWAGRMREVWRRERVDAAITWGRAELAEANPRPVLARLAELASENPLVEPLTEVLMLALHAVGRTSEALDLYARARTHLAAELGTDPGPELQTLHQSLLRGGVEAAPAAGPARLGPRQLPAPPQLFTGRVLELAELAKIHDASTVVITAIDGMAGVGKTALAVQAAHQMVDRYPDGQLFIDLHGYTEGVAPVEPGKALDWMLRSLGVAGERIPADLDERAGLYRSRLADQRMVIVLDNAATEAQVRPLLPGAPGCLVLVTSRRRLAGLDHTHTLSLDTLPRADAIALVRQTVGDSRLASQPPELVDELVELCGRLPLAIRIAAARLRCHPTWDLAYLVQRLRDQQHRLVELAAGPRSVTAALDLSYQYLSADQQRAYRLLGLHPGPDIDPYAAAALLDATLPQAGRLLEQLLDVHLLLEPTPGRYWFHDLARAHAADTAARDERQPSGSVDRLLDYFRHTAAVAMDAAYPYERQRRPQVTAALTPAPTLSDPATALAWLDGEMPSLLAAARYATEHDRSAHLLDVSSILHRHLRTRGPYHDAVALHQQALTTARATGQQATELDALTALGQVLRLQIRYEQAADHFGQALRLARTIGHHAAEPEALIALGHIHRSQGRYVQATEHYQQATQLARTIGHQAAELDAVTGLGHVCRMHNEYEQAIEHYQRAVELAHAVGHQAAALDALVGLGHMSRGLSRYEQSADYQQLALKLARATGHRAGEMNALVGLGIIYQVLGQYDLADHHYQQGLELARVAGHRPGELSALTGLGMVHRLQGRYEEAGQHYQRLLGMAYESGNRDWQFEGCQGLGRLQLATGDADGAVTHHQQALALAVGLDHPGDQARAHDGLAHAYRALKQPDQARTHWQHALDILTRLGVDHTDDEETTVAGIRTNLNCP
jgi:DNA-binding SARP family transcriptional activator/tetratricopeptide (TPR) repeat protein